MASDNPIYSSPAHPIRPDISRPQRTIESQKLGSIPLAQIPTQSETTDFAEEAVFNPLAMSRKFQDLKTKTRGGSRDEESEGAQRKKEEKQQRIEKIGAIADEYSRKSYQELKPKTLLLIKERIAKGDTADDVLRKILEVYPDYSLADEVLDFLIATSDAEMGTVIQEAKNTLQESFKREIIAGKNISNKAREFSLLGLGSPTALRDLYREITGNPRDPTILFEQFASTFPYDKMKTVIEFLLHSLGSDLKSKGPSIPRGELHRLVTETRVLQAILGVYKFFDLRMKLVESAFTRNGLTLPQKISFQFLAKLFVRYIQERYPNADKALHLGIELGVSEELDALLILLLQFRDATRQIAPRLFKSEQQRQDVLRSFMDALSQIDEKLEEEEPEDDAEKEGKKKKKRKQPPTKLT